MIKRYSNLTVSPKLSVSSRLVRSNSANIINPSGGEYTNIAHGDYLTLCIERTGVSLTEKTAEAKLNLQLANVMPDTVLKIAKLSNSINLGSNITISAIQQDLAECTVYEKTVLNEGGSTNADVLAEIDLTRFFNSLADAENVLKVAVFFRQGSSTLQIGARSPEAMNTDGEEFCIAYIAESCGLNSINKYDDHSFGKCGSLHVNLYTGKPIYSMNVLSGVKTTYPIGFSIYQNEEKNDGIINFRNKFTPSFHYKMEKQSFYIMLEDASGCRRYYEPLEPDSKRREELIDRYNIKHYISEEALYVCTLDGTYMYHDTVNSKAYLYDQNDACTELEITSNNLKVLKITHKYGKETVYTWNGNRLVDITSPESEVMRVEYDSEGYINQVLFDNYNRYAAFAYNDLGNSEYTYSVAVHDNHSVDGAANDEIINHVEFKLNGDRLVRVTDKITGYYMDIQYSSDKVSSVGIYNDDGSEKLYLSSYTYNTDYTKVNDIESNYLIYCFDNYGRATNIVDRKNRAICNEYAMGHNDNYKVVGRSKMQCHSRNMIQNHSFETGSLSPWELSASSTSSCDIIDGGMLGARCLKITALEDGYVYLKQEIQNPRVGLRFKGYIKHPGASTLTSDNIQVGIQCKYTDQIPFDSSLPHTPEDVENGYITVTRSITFCADLAFKKSGWYEFITPAWGIPKLSTLSKIEAIINVSGAEDTVYVDDLQMVNDDVKTRYNYIENGYMEFINWLQIPDSWSFESINQYDKAENVTSAGIHSSLLGSRAMKFSANSFTEFNSLTQVLPKMMYQTVPIKCVAGDHLILSLYTKGDVSNNAKLRVFVNFGETGSVYLNIKRNISDWQMHTAEIVSDGNYDRITVGIQYDGDNELWVDCFQLYKDSYGTYYGYDERGNIVETLNADSSRQNVIYGSDNKPSEVYLSNGEIYRYEYGKTATNHEGLLEKVTDLYGNTVELEYDDSERLTNTKITTGDGEEIVNSITYNDKTETLTDEFNVTASRELDYLDRVISTTNGSNFETSYSYNKKSELERIEAIVSQLNHANSMSYDDHGNTLQMTSGNGTRYNATYDDFGRIITLKLGDTPLEQYAYDDITDGYRRGNLISKTLGSTGDTYHFIYNSDNQVTEISIGDELIAQYEYDENGNLYKASDINSGITKYYTYDMSGKLVKATSLNGDTLRYSHDNLGNVQKISYNNAERSGSVDYEYVYEHNEYTMAGFINRLSSFYGDEIVVGGNGAMGLFGAKPVLATNGKKYDTEVCMNVDTFQDNADILYYPLNTLNTTRQSGLLGGRAKSYDEWAQSFKKKKTFYAFIKPQNAYSLTWIFGVGIPSTTSDNCCVVKGVLYIGSDGTLYYQNMNSPLKLTAPGTVKLNMWNFVGIQLYSNETNGESYVKIVLNGETTSQLRIGYNAENISHLMICDTTNTGSIKPTDGTMPSDSSSSSSVEPLTMPIDISFMSFGAYDYKDGDFNAIYKEALKYIPNMMDGETVNTSVLSTDPSNISESTIFYDESVYRGFDVVTLNGSLESAKGLTPIKITSADNSFRSNKARLFKYDKTLKRHIYGCYDGNEYFNGKGDLSLVYKPDMAANGTVSLRFKYESTSEKRCLISFVKNAQEVFKVYFPAGSKEFYLCTDSFEQRGFAEIEIGVWHQMVIIYDSDFADVYIDNSSMRIPLNVTLDGCEIHLGNGLGCEEPINGCMEMFAFSSDSSASSQRGDILKLGMPIAVRNEYDTIGRLKNNVINFMGDNKFNSEYVYSSTRVTEQNLYNWRSDLSIDVLKYSESISYSYDSNGNITQKIARTTESEKHNIFTYDELGRIKTETLPDLNVITYTYDKNGNILSREKKYGQNILESYSYQYSAAHSDKLIKVTSLAPSIIHMDVTYPSDDSFYPSKLYVKGAEESLSWNGKRLAGIGSNIAYEYDANGIRTKKTVNGKATEYVIEGDRVISMKLHDVDIGNAIAPTYTMNFTYDMHGTLVSVGTQDRQYFYIRDITGNILGLVDRNGNFVVRYEYDAWGNILNENVINSDIIIAVHNPFKYKGYFYDEETGWYYLKSRYYDPSIGRFISPDDPSYLEPQSLNGLNLYAYCYNNPVMFADHNGNFAKKVFWTISLGETALGIAFCFIPGVRSAGVVLIGVGVGSIINAYITESNGGTFTAGWVGGQVSGALSAIPYVGNIIGAFVGSIVTDFIDSDFKEANIEKALWSGVLSWGITIFPATISEIAGKFQIEDAAVYVANATISILTSIANSIVNVFWKVKS